RLAVRASSSICCDLSGFEILVRVGGGGGGVVVEKGGGGGGGSGAGVTLVNTVPSAMGELVRSGQVPRSARAVVLAGEALGARLVEEIHGLGHVERVLDCYGPSEDTTYSTWA